MDVSVNEKWARVFEDKEYAISVLKMNKDDAKRSLSERGFDFSDDEMAEMAAKINELLEYVSENGELDEETLLKVAGGGHIGDYLTGIGLGILVGIGGFLAAW